MPHIYAGAAKRIITPPLGENTVFLAGFQENRIATDVHDDLYARACAIRVEEKAHAPETADYFVLVVCDLIGLFSHDVQRVRRAIQDAGLDARGVVVACTHTHSGPDTLGLWGSNKFQSGVDPFYQAFVIEQISEAVQEAVTALRPARLRAGHTRMTKWLKNARQANLVDDTLTVLQAEQLEGKPVFTLVNLACHPEVQFGQNMEISADYAGAVCQEIENTQGGVGILAVADLGGMMTPDVQKEERTWATVQAMGQDVAQTALEALEQGATLPPSRLHFQRYDVHIPLDNPMFKLSRAIGVLPHLTLDEQNRIRTQAALLDLGMLRLVTIPGELLPRPGLALRTMLHTPYHFLIGMADDELGYLIDSGEFAYPPNPLEPGAHYEETMSISQNATPLLMEAWAALLGGLER